MAANKIHKAARATTMATTMVALSALAAQNAQATPATLNIEARIAPAGDAITAPDALSFGSFMVDGGAGSIVVNPVGAPVFSQATEVGSPSAGNIRIFVEGGPRDVTLSLDSTSVVINDGNGNDMTVDNFHLNTDGAGTTYGVTGVTGNPGTVLVPVGGTLNFDAAQPAGSYSGSLLVNANFN